MEFNKEQKKAAVDWLFSYIAREKLRQIFDSPKSSNALMYRVVMALREAAEDKLITRK